MPVWTASRIPADTDEAGCVDTYCSSKPHMSQGALPALRPAEGVSARLESGGPKAVVAQASSDLKMSTRDYVLSSDIPSLLDAVTAALLHDTPSDPVDYMHNWFRMERTRAAGRLEEMRGEIGATEEAAAEGASNEDSRSSFSSATAESDAFPHLEVPHVE